MDRIDFRSDTVTWPTAAMREAIAAAPVGDDVYGEDPTVNELEALAAEMVGKEAGLFVASGTMGNLTAILTHANRGAAAIAGRDAHAIRYEAGGLSALGGVVPRTLPTNEEGRLNPAAVDALAAEEDEHVPRAALLLLENSYGARNGYPLPPVYLQQTAAVARRHGLAVHLDGARLFNAAVALGVAPAAITEHVDSVTFCLSKGLCAPVGSVLCGSADFVARARRTRKVLGGGMRQAGVIAAAGLVSLRAMVERLTEDHANARRLAEGLAAIPGVAVAPPAVRTNIIFFRLEDGVPVTAGEVADHLRVRANIWVGANGPRSFRAVTHYWIGREEVDLLLDTLRELLD